MRKALASLFLFSTIVLLTSSTINPQTERGGQPPPCFPCSAERAAR